MGDTIDTTTVDSVTEPPGGGGIIASTDGPRASANTTPVNTQIRRKVSQWRRFVRECVPDWATNNDYRRGKPFATDSDTDRVAVNLDFPSVKRKHAGVYSQTPKVRLTPKHPSFRPGVPVFAKKVNDTIAQAGIAAAMFETVPDALSTAGFGAVHIAFESRTEQRDVDLAKIRASVMPPPSVPPAGPDGQPPAPQIVSLPFSTAKRFTLDRVSPVDLICDLAFTGSDFNKSALIGRRGRMRWAQALKEFGKSTANPNGLVEADRVDVCGRDTRDSLDRLGTQDEQQNAQDTEIVLYDEVYYRKFMFDPNEMSFEAIQRVVFVNGKQTAVIDEKWKGQKALTNYGLAGSCLFPIQVLTFDYLSDEIIPPSLTALARPQVDELIECRTQMLMQRRLSIPWRWIDTNRVPSEIATVLMRGQWLGAIPMNGSGERAMGEVARASFPRETFEFNSVAKQDADTIYGAGGSFNGGGGGNTQIRTAAEANAVSGLAQTVNAMDRARVTGFFCNIAEVVAGLVCLFGVFDEEDKAKLGGLNRDLLSSYYAYDVSADSTVLLDAGQQFQRLEAFFNIALKTGYLDPLDTLQKMADLSGVDPDSVRVPSGVKPDPLNISLRLSGAEELDDPRIVALLMHSGQMFNPQELEAAKQVIIQSKQLPQPTAAPDAPGPGGPPPPGAPGDHQPPPQMQPTHATAGDAHPQAETAGRINTRRDDGK